jgi:hypothetical protein
MRTRWVLLLTLLTVPVWAGKRIVMTSTVNGVSQRSETWIEAGRMRSDIQDLGTALFLTDNDHPRLVVVDRASNTYSVMDAKSLREITAKVEETFRKIEEMAAQTLANVPPEHRAEMEALLKPTSLPKIESRVVGERAFKSIRCTVHEVRFQGELTEEVCSASPADLGLAPAEVALFDAQRKFGEESAQILKTLPALSSMEGLFQSLGTLPIQTFTFENDRKIGEVLLESIEDASFTDADFSLGDAKERKLALP